ncbi:MAG TPA: hypothetical protein VLD67_20150 [Vicinamibacterales bacterium]|nr:hypothetical protein [Vicinamibacterales bacterium]
MTGINWTRVLLGGLAAGVVMNASEAALHGGMLGGDAQALFARYQVPDLTSAVPMASLILMTFVLGIAAVWLYAAIRPRFGPGPRTAIIAGLAVWVMAHLWSGVYLGMGFMGLITPRLAFLPIAWGLVEAPLATLVGGWIYNE